MAKPTLKVELEVDETADLLPFFTLDDPVSGVLDNTEYPVCGASKDFEFKIFNKSFDLDESGKQFEINEKNIIISIFKEKGIVPNPPGIFLNGEKYFLVDFDKDTNVCYLSKPNGGACIAMTNKCVIIGTWNKNVNEAHNHGACNTTIEEFANQFIGCGY